MSEEILKVFTHYGTIHEGVDAINNFIDECKACGEMVYPHGIQYLLGTPGQTVLYYEIRT